MTRLEEIRQRLEEIEEEEREFIPLEEIDDYFPDATPLEIFNKIFFGDIGSYYPEYIKINGYGNFENGDNDYNELQEEKAGLEEELEELENEYEEDEEEL